MKIESAIEFLPKGSTRPFLAYNDLKEKVVVKAMTRPTTGKILLNEYLAGNLAVAVGLTWPKTSLASLSSNSMQFLRDNSVDVQSTDCVAMQFEENLTPINWPKPPQGSDRWNVQNSHLLPEVNNVHMRSYFDNPEKQTLFYGRALFEIWLFFRDTKYDTLFMLPNRTPFFLDGSHAFEGSDWEIDQMNYSRPITFPMSPYLEGILTDQNLFDEWFNRIESIPDAYISSLLNDIPMTWVVTPLQLNFLLNILTTQRKHFLNSWKQNIINHFRTVSIKKYLQFR